MSPRLTERMGASEERRGLMDLKVNYNLLVFNKVGFSKQHWADNNVILACEDAQVIPATPGLSKT